MSPHFERALRFAETQQNHGEPGETLDWTLSEVHRLALEFQTTHDQAIHAAAMKAVSWSEEAGGAGHGGDGYMNLAKAIDALKVDR